MQARVTLQLQISVSIQPSIAQLVERWTVVVMHQKSIGRWFKSGSKEFLHLNVNVGEMCSLSTTGAVVNSSIV